MLYSRCFTDGFASAVHYGQIETLDPEEMTQQEMLTNADRIYYSKEHKAYFQ